jgi:hypothetical protein
MALESGDSDIKKTWLKTSLGGNGDYYITVISESNGLKYTNTVRIPMSGGIAPSNVKNAVANLFKEMERESLNEYPEFGAIDSNNKLRFLEPGKTVTTDAISAVKTQEKEQVVVKKELKEEEELFDQPIPLTGGKIAIFKYPKGKMKKKDLETLDMFMKLIKVSEGISDDEKENEKE